MGRGREGRGEGESGRGREKEGEGKGGESEREEVTWLTAPFLLLPTTQITKFNWRTNLENQLVIGTKLIQLPFGGH